MENLPSNTSNFILYTTPEGEVQLNILLQDETIWLTQKAMGELFSVSKSTISEHIANIFETQELQKEAPVRNFRTVQQ
jgi:hypothetical protein